MLLPKKSHLAQVLLRSNDVNVSSPHLLSLPSFSGVIPRKSNCQRKKLFPHNSKWGNSIFLFVRLPLTVFLCTPTQGHTSVGLPVKACIHHFCADIWCHQEDSPRAMVDMDRWLESEGGDSKEPVLSARFHDDNEIFQEEKGTCST